MHAQMLARLPWSSNIQFNRSIGDKLTKVYEHDQIISVDRIGKSTG